MTHTHTKQDTRLSYIISKPYWLRRNKKSVID